GGPGRWPEEKIHVLVRLLRRRRGLLPRMERMPERQRPYLRQPPHGQAAAEGETTGPRQGDDPARYDRRQGFDYPSRGRLVAMAGRGDLGNGATTRPQEGISGPPVFRGR